MRDRERVWTVLDMLEWATGYFKQKGVPNPRLSIEWLLAEILDIRRLDLYLKYDRPLSAGELDRLRPMVRRRGDHEPLQYIAGYTDFMDCRIEVGPEVLIPRSETEQLVELILRENSSEYPLSVLDIGTGSGCIPVSIKKSRRQWYCTGVDISEPALKRAERNSLINNVQIELLHADLQSLKSEPAFEQRAFDLIISNPPYILPVEKKDLEPEVSDYEPANALIHPDPLKLYNCIGEFASQALGKSGKLYLECNPLLVREIKQSFEKKFEHVEICTDLDNRDRFLKASGSKNAS